MQCSRTGETSASSFTSQASASSSPLQSSNTFIPSGQGAEASHSALETKSISKASQEDIYVHRIDSLLQSNADNEQIADLYKEISQYLLKDDRAIPERDKENGFFKNVSIDPKLCIAVKRLLSRYVEQRYQNFLAKRKKETHPEWYKKREWQDLFKTVTTAKELALLSNSSQKSPELQFMTLGLVDAWSSILHDHIFNHDHLKREHFHDHVVTTKVVPFYSVIPHHTSGLDTVYLYKKYFQPQVMTNPYSKPHIPEYSKEIRDQAELFHIFTGTHYLLNENDTHNITDDGISVCIPDFTGIPLEKINTSQDPLLLTDKQQVSPMFFNTCLTLPRSSDLLGILAVLQPETRQLWIFPRRKEDKSLAEKVINKMEPLNSEACNIIYFSLNSFATELAELGELAETFTNAPQFQITTPFRSSEITLESKSLSLANYELLHSSFSKASSRPVSFTFHSITQSFCFTQPSIITDSKFKTYHNPFEWKTTDSRQPATNNLMRLGLSFLLECYKNFQCPITHARADELTKVIFDKNGFVFEEEKIREWLRINGNNATHPVTRAPMSPGDLCDNTFMRQLWLMMRTVSLDHDLSIVKMPRLGDLHSPSSTSEMPGIAKKALEEYQNKMSGLSKMLAQQLQSYQKQALACEVKLTNSLDECFNRSKETDPKIKKKEEACSLKLPVKKQLHRKE